MSNYVKKRPVLGHVARSLAISPTEGFELKGGDVSQKLLLASFSETAKDLKKDAKSVSDALATFKTAKDKKMEAISELVLANIYYKQGSIDKTLTAGTSAMTIFTSLGDKLGQAKASHAKALAAALTEDFATAVSLGTAAAAIYSELGMEQGKMLELQSISEWYLSMGKPSSALKAAKEALAIAQAGESKETEAIPLCLACEALCASGKSKQAVSLASDAVASFKEASDNIAIGMGLEVLLYTKMKSSDPDITQAAEDALSTIRDLNETRAELSLLFVVGEIRNSAAQLDDAIVAIKDCQALAKELDDKSAEALSHLLIAAFYSEADATKEDEDMLSEANSSVQEAADIYAEIGDAAGQVSCKIVQAKLTGEVKEALPLAKEAVVLASEVGSAEAECTALSFITDTYGSSDDALDAATSMVEVCRGLGKKKLAEALYTLGSILTFRGSMFDADDAISEGKAICSELGLSGLEAKLILLPVQVYVAELANEKDPSKPSDSFIDVRDKAYDAVKKAMILSAKAGDLATRGSALYWKSQVLMWAGRSGEALQAAKDAEKAYDKSSDAKGQLMTYLLLGESLTLLAKKGDAREYSSKALELARSSSELEVFESAAMSLSEKLEEKKVVMQAMEMAALPAAGAAPAAAASAAAATTVAKMEGPVVIAKVTDLVKGVLTDEDDVDVDTPFMEAGIDSLGSVQLVTDVGREFRMNLAPSVVFDFPTIRELGDHLVAEING